MTKTQRISWRDIPTEYDQDVKLYFLEDSTLTYESNQLGLSLHRYWDSRQRMVSRVGLPIPNEDSAEDAIASLSWVIKSGEFDRILGRVPRHSRQKTAYGFRRAIPVPADVSVEPKFDSEQDVVLAIQSESIEIQIPGIHAAETRKFSECQSELLEGLSRFVTNNRFAVHGPTVTAVCAAIRKFALLCSEEQLHLLAQWLKPNGRDVIHYDVELEIVKTCNWRLQFTTVESIEHFSDVKESLSEIINQYLHVRLIPQQNFAAICLNAITALTTVNAVMKEEADIRLCLDDVRKLNLSWFRNLVLRRLMAVAETIKPRFPEAHQLIKSCIDE